MTQRSLLPRGLVIGFLLFVLLIGIGTIGFMIAGLGPVDALYTTVSAVTTVGYAPTHTLSPAAKLFVSGLVLSGVGLGIYVLSAFTEYLVEGRLFGSLETRRREKHMRELSDHFIIAGFGRVGQRVAGQLESAGTPYIVVDNNPQVLALARERGVPYLEADATSDEQLLSAGIMRAQGLLACSDSDMKNVYMTLSAHSLNPALYIVARASDEHAERNLYNAGASRVISPYVMAGNRMAHLAIQPLAADYVELVLHGESVGVRIEERLIEEDSALTGQTVGKIRHGGLSGAQILALEHDDTVITDVSDDLVIQTGDRILFAGTAAQLAQVDAALGGASSVPG